uniref:Disease resistance protein At4g27190-like leucine-rich repeats domain-containing protein n=1 Tax=Ficus carica TaxID=3494 RepID=A0AA88EBW1_FICCA|nr:hypothetical protein TIFTF001_053464 [Ficus carica]
MPTSPPTRSIERPTLFNDKVVFSKLQELTIQGCKSLLSVWALATVERLQQLKNLSIGYCDLIEEVLVITKEAGDHEETESKKITFPKLESLELRYLPKLKRFGLCQADDHYTVEFPSLLRIHITNCPELSTFIAKSIPSTSTTVEEVEERRMAEEIMFSQKVVFNNLQELTIQGCKSLQSVWALATVERLQQLKKLRIGHRDLIEPNVISRLVQLEELYMEDVGEINASLVVVLCQKTCLII